MPTLEMVSLIHSFRSFPTEWQRREINKKTKEDDWGGEIEESARLIAQQAAGSQSILWEWVNKQRVINAFIQRGEMFCMAWFMELSRLSNSLGSVYSQRRGRLAAGAGRPRLPHFLSHRSPPIPPLSTVTGAFSVSLCQRPHSSSWPARVLCSVVPNVTLCPNTGLIIIRVPQPAVEHQHNGTLSAGVWLSAAPRGLSSSSSKPPNLRSETAFGMKPSESAHYFTSCPVRHSPKHLDLTGSRRVEPATFQTEEFNSKCNQIKALIYIFVFGNKRRKRVVLLGTNNTDLLNWSVDPRNPKYVDLGSCQMFFGTVTKIDLISSLTLPFMA